MKKDDIIQSAKKLFTTYGYKKVSMDEIALNAGVTKKTIYSYFKDKNDLFNYFVLEELKNMKNIIEKNDKLDKPYFKKIHQTIYELIKYKKENQFLGRISKDAEVLNNMQAKESIKMFDDAIIKYIKEKIEIAIEQKKIKTCDSDIAAFVIYKVYAALMYDWSSENKELDEKEFSDNITKILKDGIFIKQSQAS